MGYLSPTVRHGTFVRHQGAPRDIRETSSGEGSRRLKDPGNARAVGEAQRSSCLVDGATKFGDNAMSIRLNSLDHVAPGNARGMRRLQYDDQHFLSRDAMEAGAHVTVSLDPRDHLTAPVSLLSGENLVWRVWVSQAV